MALLVTDPDLESELIKERQESGGDRFDEIWEGLYVMAPLANNEHQDLQANFVAALKEVFGWDPSVRIGAGMNISDREEDWIFNYRCPDVVVFLPGNPAKNHGTHWEGGPDFLVEIASPGDHPLKKLPFYASVGVREALIVYRDPWMLELYASAGPGAEMKLIEAATLEQGLDLHSGVLPITLKLSPSQPRPNVRLSLAPSANPLAAGRTSWLL